MARNGAEWRGAIAKRNATREEMTLSEIFEPPSLTIMAQRRLPVYSPYMGPLHFRVLYIHVQYKSLEKAHKVTRDPKAATIDVGSNTF